MIRWIFAKHLRIIFDPLFIHLLCIDNKYHTSADLLLKFIEFKYSFYDYFDISIHHQCCDRYLNNAALNVLDVQHMLICK
jgi:hypothetical protein